MKRFLTATILLIVLLAPAAARCDTPVSTRASKVTLFIDGAQVTREKQVELPSGVTTLRFVGLSPHLDAGSMQVAARGKFTVLSVERNLRPVDSLERSTQQQKIELRIEAANDEYLRTKASKESILSEIELLKTNCSTASRTAQVPLSAVRELTDYYTAQLRTFKERLLAAEKKMEQLSARRQELNKQLRMMQGKPEDTMSEVVVRVEAEKPCRGSFTLTYYVRNAGWLPAYDVRSDALSQPLALSYRAQVFQHTGETWEDVALTLFSTNPATGNIAPQLRTYWLDYGVAAPRYDTTVGTNAVSGIVFDAEEREPLIGVSVLVPGTTLGTTTDQNGRYSLTLPEGYDRLRFSYIGMQEQTRTVTGPTLDVALQPDRTNLDEVVVTAYGSNTAKMALSGAAAGVKTTVETDFLYSDDTAEEELASEAVEVRQDRKQMGYEFAIRRPYTIPSDGKAVSVEIGRYELPAVYVYRCSPKADRDAFLVAETRAHKGCNLLEGEANIYFEQTFVGKSVLNPDTQSDTLRFSLGRDRSILVRREKETDYTHCKAAGSSQVQSIGWLLSVRNTRQEAVTLTLCDQLPVSCNSQIVVTAEELSGGEFDPRTGSVTWQLELQPGEQRDLRLRYKVKYPKGRSLRIE